MSKEYYKKKIIDLRAAIDKEKEAKKRDAERDAMYIKRATTPSSKASYRSRRLIMRPHMPNVLKVSSVR